MINYDGKMLKIFRWLLMLITLVALNNCQAFPTASINKPQEEPEILYIQNGKLIRQTISKASQEILPLSDMGKVKDALKVDDMVFILSEFGLQKVILADHKVEVIEQFGDPIISGGLFATNLHLYYSIADDALYQYDITKENTHIVLSFPNQGFFRPLGLTQNGSGFFLLPLAGDPEFPAIWVVNLYNSDVKELPVQFGCEMAALSPNQRKLALQEIHYGTDENLREYGLGLFDL
ncbi:MAG: hypothetical protein ABFD79_06880, partial [Phycisphaerales bacterium]